MEKGVVKGLKENDQISVFERSLWKHMGNGLE